MSAAYAQVFIYNRSLQHGCSPGKIRTEYCGLRTESSGKSIINEKEVKGENGRGKVDQCKVQSSPDRYIRGQAPCKVQNVNGRVQSTGAGI